MTQDPHGHASDWGTWNYVQIFIALMVLTAVTVAVAYVDLGQWNIVVALLVAFVKTSLVLWYFMHLRTEYRLNWIFAVSGFFWVAVLIIITMTDVLTRNRATVILSSDKYTVPAATTEHH